MFLYSKGGNAYGSPHLVYNLCKNTTKNKKDQTVKEKIQITKRLTKDH